MRRSGLIIMITCMSALPAIAEDRVSTEAIYACAEIAEDAERLACFDNTVAQFRAAEDAGEVATISKEELSELNRESFGLSLPSLPKTLLPKFGSSDDTKLDTISEPVKSTSRLSSGKLRITLENGQVWDQIDTKDIYVSRKRGVESAEIKRASLGSFKMKLDGGRSFRVTRAK